MKAFFLISLITLTSLQAEVRGWWDIAPREYPDLNYSYREVAAENNSLSAISSLMESLAENEEHEQWSQAMSKRQQFNRSSSLILLHEQSLAQLKKLLTKDLQSSGDTSIAASYSDEMRMISAADFLANQAELKATENSPNDAVALVGELFTLSDKMIRTDGGLVNYLVGCACYTKSFSTAIELTSTQSLPSAELGKLAHKINAPIATQTRLENALNFEFTCFRKMLIDLHLGVLEQQEAPEFRFKPRFLANYLKRLFIRNYFQPNTTIELIAEDVREAKQDKHVAQDQRKQRVNKPQLFAIFSSNLIGLKLREAISPAWHKSNTREIKAQHGLTRIYVALARYAQDQKQLPEKLAELTPKYLKALPLDPYSNQEFQYSKERKLLWSIGDDLKDNHGISKAALEKREADKVRAMRKTKKKKSKKTRHSSAAGNQEKVKRIAHSKHLSDTDEPHLPIPF